MCHTLWASLGCSAKKNQVFREIKHATNLFQTRRDDLFTGSCYWTVWRITNLVRCYNSTSCATNVNVQSSWLAKRPRIFSASSQLTRRPPSLVYHLFLFNHVYITGPRKRQETESKVPSVRVDRTEKISLPLSPLSHFPLASARAFCLKLDSADLIR